MTYYNLIEYIMTIIDYKLVKCTMKMIYYDNSIVINVRMGLSTRID